MNLSSYLKNKEISPEDILLYTVGTDGFRNHSNLLSVSLKYFGSDKVEHIYVKGAEPALVKDYIGVTDDYYNSKSVCDDRLREILTDYKAKVKVTYNHSFMERFLNPQIIEHPFKDIPTIDVSLYYILKLGNVLLPDTLELTDFNARCTSVGVGVPKKTYSFKKMLTDFDIKEKPDDIIQNEYCIKQLEDVFNYLILS